MTQPGLRPRRHAGPSGADTPPSDQPVAEGSAGTLIAAVVLQAGQALMWMFVGLLVGMGDGDVSSGQPVRVVLVIAAILAFAVGAFVLALAAGTLGRSDACRIASVVFQAVSSVIIIGGAVDLIGHRTGAGMTITLDPTTGPAFLVSPGFIAAMLVSSVAVAVLLLCRQSSWATRYRLVRSVAGTTP
ncbi:MAG TPA: hypothetical protein VFX16_20725 [Pseudonocardiaceae bacterium]|nr:hypothetical protein [Pseudonocardiaceae bacterium]